MRDDSNNTFMSPAIGDGASNRVTILNTLRALDADVDARFPLLSNGNLTALLRDVDISTIILRSKTARCEWFDR